MERTNVTNDDKGKRVVNFNGDNVGVVSGVEGDAAHVSPDAELSDVIRSKLGWSDMNESEYVLPNDQIEAVTDEEIRLKNDI